MRLYASEGDWNLDQLSEIAIGDAIRALRLEMPDAVPWVSIAGNTSTQWSNEMAKCPLSPTLLPAWPFSRPIIRTSFFDRNKQFASYRLVDRLIILYISYYIYS